MLPFLKSCYCSEYAEEQCHTVQQYKFNLYSILESIVPMNDYISYCHSGAVFYLQFPGEL
jgi:hypothetical protein